MFFGQGVVANVHKSQIVACIHDAPLAPALVHNLLLSSTKQRFWSKLSWEGNVRQTVLSLPTREKMLWGWDDVSVFLRLEF